MSTAVKKQTLVILLQSTLILTLTWLLWQMPQSQQVDAEKITSELQDFQRILQQLSGRMDVLESQVREELDARKQLESRLNELQQWLLNASSAFKSAEQSENQPNSSSASDTDAIKEVDDVSIQQKLIQQGLPIATVSMLQSYIDRKRIQRLRLKNQAKHRRRQDSGDFIDNMFDSRDIVKGIRREFGEKVYDHYLYASGRANRVVVRETVPGSIAESVGIKPGDIIVSYANQPIFSMIDLRKATSRGLSGVATLIELRRDNQPYAMTVPRGALGVLLDYTRLKP